MKSLSVLVLLISINNIFGQSSLGSTDKDSIFTIRPPRVCVNSKQEIFSNLIKTSNRNFVRAYQRYLPQECNYTPEVVKIVEAYRNAANYVVIFLNKRDATNEQFNEVVELYDLAIRQFYEDIRKLSLGKRLTRMCYSSLMMIKGAVTTTGDGLVSSTITTYDANCSSDNIRKPADHSPIQFVSNYLN